MQLLDVITHLDCVKLTAVQEKETNRITENFHLSGRHHQRFIKIHNVIQYIYSKQHKGSLRKALLHLMAETKLGQVSSL